MPLPSFSPSRSGRRPSLRRQRGNAIVATTLLITVVMALAAGLTNLFLVSEGEQVEDTLSQTRVYWAMYGHLRYMLSRAALGGLCGATKDTLIPANNATADCSGTETASGSLGYPATSGRDPTSRDGSLQDYLETANGPGLQNGTIDHPGNWLWAYPQTLFTADDAGNPLNFSVRGVVQPRRNESDSVIGKGEMRLDLEVTGTGTAPAFRYLDSRFGRLTVGFCVVDQNSATPPTNSATAGCVSAAALEGRSRIQFIQREHPFCYANASCQ